MRSLARRSTVSALVLCLGAGPLAGCTEEPQLGYVDIGVPLGSFQLVAFDTCQEALDGLRGAAKSIIGPYGFFTGPGWGMPGPEMADSAALPAAPPVARADAAAGAAEKSSAGAAPSYSGTNTHEVGVDEPDLVKTDGHRIVTVSGGTLRVVDAASREQTGFIDISDPDLPDDVARYIPADLLLAGDHALVLLQEQVYGWRGGPAIDMAVPNGAMPGGNMIDPVNPDKVAGPKLLLIDLSGHPKVLSRLSIDGGLVDARQVGSIARIVVRSAPRLVFPYAEKATDEQRLAANQAIIEQAGIEAWLPRIEATNGGQTTRTEISCGEVKRPDRYTGTSLLTVLTVDLSRGELGDGSPTVLVADGNTVYSNGESLYVASDSRWRVAPMLTTDGTAVLARTEVYKFDTREPGRPVFVAGGSVPGYLINQYAMSEWDGHLRMATTTEAVWRGDAQQTASESGVYVLAHRGRSLTGVGSVTGLGKGERIYSVRFTGPVGYVVTFRQTDPLYTVDLRDPTKPTVRGELKIPGYSAYLHPVGADKLIGIGQDATDRGRVKGTQVSLFDVGDLTNPARIAQYSLSGAHSEAEFDPHAFLYWPAENLLVVPLQRYGMAVPDNVRDGGKMVPNVGALVLRVNGSSISEVGFLEHPGGIFGDYPRSIRRSLVIDRTLWTVSDSGLMANDLRTLQRVAWIQFN